MSRPLVFGVLVVSTLALLAPSATEGYSECCGTCDEYVYVYPPCCEDNCCAWPIMCLIPETYSVCNCLHSQGQWDTCRQISGWQCISTWGDCIILVA